VKRYEIPRAVLAEAYKRTRPTATNRWRFF